jgi:hypothetical protein
LKFALPDPVEPKYSFSLKPPMKETVELAKEMGTSQHSSSISLTSLQGQSTLRSRGITPVNTNTGGDGNAKEERHVLMVDQLWMWILDASKSATVSAYGRNDD